MKALNSCAHSLRLRSPDADPVQMHSPGERGGVGEYPVVIGLGIKLPVADFFSPLTPYSLLN